MTKFTDLTATTSLDDTDILAVVKDPSGTPLSRKITGANLKNSMISLMPFANYIDAFPITASAKYPFGASIGRNTTLLEWTQAIVVVTTNNGSNYWTISIVETDGTLVNSMTTAALTNDVWATITDSTFTVSSLTTADIGLQIKCDKTGSPGGLYLLCPHLRVTYS